MAIGENATIGFFGTQDDLNDTSGSVADGAFSVAGDLLQLTNDDDALNGAVVLQFTCALTPNVGSAIKLYAQLISIVSTNDAQVPTANFPHTFLASIPVKDVTSEQFVDVQINLPGVEASQVYQYFIENLTGVSINAGWRPHNTPKAAGPHPA